MADRTRSAHNVVDRTGQRFGRLVVIERAGRRGTAAAWLCQCDCGSRKIITSNSLRGGYAKSCGCSRATGPGSRPNYRTTVLPGSAARKAVLKNYRLSAKHRGIVWALSEVDFDELTSADCAYCGCPPGTVRRVSRNGSFTYNGIDRIDNQNGYVVGNVVPCCPTCNHAKKDMPQAEFMVWITRLIAHNSPVAGP
jgi:hypothetical protein